MNSVVTLNIIRFIGLLLIQVLVLKYLDSEFSSYIRLFIYPLAILLLPVRTPAWIYLPLAFLLGISIDLFYDSPGVHASALVFMAFARPLILGFLEPRLGYGEEDVPTLNQMGFLWFIQYCAILLFIHILIYFSVEIFTPVYFIKIILSTLVSFVLSMLLIVVFNYIFNTKQ